MIIVSAREFRGEQSKFFEQAKKGDDVVVKSRNYGSFKLVPISDDDTLMSKEAFYEQIERAISEVKAGKTFKPQSDESLDEFLTRMEKEGNVQPWVYEKRFDRNDKAKEVWA